MGTIETLLTAIGATTGIIALIQTSRNSRPRLRIKFDVMTRGRRDVGVVSIMNVGRVPVRPEGTFIELATGERISVNTPCDVSGRYRTETLSPGSRLQLLFDWRELFDHADPLLYERAQVTTHTGEQFFGSRKEMLAFTMSLLSLEYGLERPSTTLL